MVAHSTLIRASLSGALGRSLQGIDNAALTLAHHHAVDGWQLEYFNGRQVGSGVQG